MVWFSQIASDTLLPEQEFLAKLPLLFFACSKFCSSAPPPGGFFEGLSRAPLSLGPTHQHQGIPTPISHTDTPKCPQTFHKAFSKGASPIPTSRSKGGSSLLHIWLILILRYFKITRPKPAYGRQGLDWIVGPGYSFVVFSTVGQSDHFS